MNKTANYNLNQWVKADRVLMEDFNADNAKIDAALGALAGRMGAAENSALRLAVGRYVGTGSKYAALDLSQSLGKPARVLVTIGNTSPKFIMWEKPTSTTASWSADTSYQAYNEEGVTYRYFALG